MNSDTGLIAPLVQSFFTDHLVRQRRASPQTVASYRDTFRLLIQHLSQTTGRKPYDLTLDDLQAKAIMRFLDGIERDRGNSVQTRNARLAAIRSFFRLVTLREPARLDLAAQVLAIPTKRADRRLIGYLTRPEMDALLATPSTQTWIGKRDYALLLTLYNIIPEPGSQKSSLYGSISSPSERPHCFTSRARAARNAVSHCGRLLPARCRPGLPSAAIVATASCSPALVVDRCPLTGPPTSSSKLYDEPCQPAPRSKPRGFLPTSFATPRRCTFFNPESKSQ